MLYSAYELQQANFTAASAMATVGSEILSNPIWAGFSFAPVMASALNVFAHATSPRGKPEFGLTKTIVDGVEHPITEAIVLRKAFGNLLRFTHSGLPDNAPRILLVAPMSGHYATLLRGTVARLLENHVVYVTDWADAKMVSIEEGRFDLDDYIDYLIEFLAFIGPKTHIVAVCQPSVPAFAATALMNAQKHPACPATLTVMGGPIDTREAPTSVNDIAVQRPYSWFENTVIATIPHNHPGAGRQVYPGFMQLAGFISMNLKSHMMSHYQMFKHLVDGDGESADASKEFYDEYRSVCDMTAEFYLQTIEHVFQKHSLPKGEFVHRGVKIDPAAITETAILAIEGERDDISGLGQTKAALDLASHLAQARKKYFFAEEVGHYGIFNGSKWRNKIAPVIEDWIIQHG